MREIMTAMERWPAVAKADGREIPVPQYKPAICR
jgi:hypothetical protein